MATFSNHTEPFYDDLSNRSPRPFRGPQTNRHQPGRVDGYPGMQGMFGSDNAVPSLRFGGVSNRDAFGAPLQVGGSSNMNPPFPFDINAAQTWNGGPPLQSFAGNGVNSMNQNGDFGPNRGVKTSRGRMGINSTWFDGPQPQQQQNPSLLAPRGGLSGRPDMQDDDEELIPTAIVIKNIPFAVKKEQLVQLMVDMSLPLPYAFNYHFDNGVFRGLAFANFTSPSETDQVINALNHMELSGRKLRVEYKKMLPLAERERIEREKRERRGQLEEQHRPLPGQGQLNSQLSLGSMTRNTPSPLSQRGPNKPGMPPSLLGSTTLTEEDVDMNDPKTLEFYTEMMLFRRDPSREVLIFPPTLDPASRRIVHTLAHHMGLAHTSRGNGEQRQVHIHRPAPGTNVSPPSASGGFAPTDNMRQNLARTSISDFGEGRAYEPMFNNNILRGQSSVGLLDVVDSTYGRNADSNLRNAKSFADLRSWSPSPVPSSASFPAALQNNGTRLQAQAQGLNDTAGSNTPTLTPTASSSGAGPRDEPFLISGISNMNIGNGTGSQTSPRRQPRLYGAGSAWGDDTYQPKAIGSHRTVSMGPDSTTQDRNPIRQSRGPNSNMNGFPARRNGRGSDELRSTTSAIAE